MTKNDRLEDIRILAQEGISNLLDKDVEWLIAELTELRQVGRTLVESDRRTFDAVVKAQEELKTFTSITDIRILDLRQIIWRMVNSLIFSNGRLPQELRDAIVEVLPDSIEIEQWLDGQMENVSRTSI